MIMCRTHKKGLPLLFTLTLGLICGLLTGPGAVADAVAQTPAQFSGLQPHPPATTASAESAAFDHSLQPHPPASMPDDNSWHSDRSANVGLRYRPVQISFFYPIGSNGIDAPLYTSTVSVNVLLGYNGALDKGYEFGLVNMHKYYTHARFQAGLLNMSGGQHAGFSLAALGTLARGPMQGLHFSGLLNASAQQMQGLQLAGLANISGASIQGVQGAGLVNAAPGGILGMQAAGLLNFSGASVQGIQAAGLANISMGSIQGVQLSGIANASLHSVQGVQAAGMFNVSAGAMEGVLVSGLGNLSRESMKGVGVAGIGHLAIGSVEGIAVSGILTITPASLSGVAVSGGANMSAYGASGVLVSGLGNASRSFEGVAVSGGFNLAAGLMQGIQVAGLFNVAQPATGIQVAGLFNAARSATGLQVAPINMARRFEGVPVGLVNIYGNGRWQIDSWTDETGFISTGLRTGTREVYNTFAIGYQPFITGRDVYALSWTIGLSQPMGEVFERAGRLDGWMILRDFTISHIHDDAWFSDNMTRRYSYRYLFGREVTPAFMLYAGPSLNMLTGRNEALDDFYPYSIVKTSRDDRQFRFWLGVSFGIQLFTTP